MKLNYFGQKAADLDDEELKGHIRAKVVPAACLLGGALVTRAVEAGEDPCSRCPGPRNKCGGRARVVEAETSNDADDAELRGLTDDEAGARKLLRRGYIRTLMTWMKESG